MEMQAKGCIMQLQTQTRPKVISVTVIDDRIEIELPAQPHEPLKPV